MCRYKLRNTPTVSGEYFTLGIHRTAQFVTPTSHPPLTPSPVNHQPPSAPVVTSSRPGTTSGPRYVSAGSRAENGNKSHSARTSVIDEQQVDSINKDLRSLRQTSNGTTTTATTAATDADANISSLIRQEAAVYNDSAAYDGAVGINDVEAGVDVSDIGDDMNVDDDQKRDVIDDVSRGQRVAALVYHGIRYIHVRFTVRYVVCRTIVRHCHSRAATGNT